MPYIGNTIRAADDYRLIDDISSGFNGSETSFALQVAGSAPVPFPKSPQQVLISVNGVIQEPDPTGSSGFNLVGTNIVFSSAPTNGHAFFGIIYATADYLNAGGNFPAGSLGAPSITFIGDENSGLYRKSGGSVGFVSDATEIANFDSNGITISSGNIIIPDSIIHNGDTNTKIRFPAADTVTVETGGTERLKVDSNGRLAISLSTARASGGVSGMLQVERADGNGAINIVQNQNNAAGSPSLVLAKSRGTSVGSNTVVANNDTLGSLKFVGADGTDLNTPAAQIAGQVDGTPGSNDMPGRLVFSTTADGASSLTEHMRIDSSGRVGIRNTSMSSFNGGGDDFVIGDGTDGQDPGITLLAHSSDNCSIFFNDTSDTGITGLIQYRHDVDALRIFTATAERMRIDSSGFIGIGNTSPSSAHGGARNLVIGTNSGDNGMTIISGSSGVGHIEFSDGTSTAATRTAGGIRYYHNSNYMRFNTNGGTERMRIDSSGNVGIGTTPNEKLVVSGNAGVTGALFITSNTSTPSAGAFLYRPASNTLALGCNSSERMRLDSAGRLLHGFTTNTSVCSTAGANVQVHNNNSVLGLSVCGYGNNSGGAILALGHSRGTTVGDVTGAVINNDELGTIRFGGSDGTDINNTSAFITGLVDGSVSGNSVPGELALGVNNGAGSNANCILIRSDFDIFLGGASGANRMFQNNSKGFVYDHDGGGNHPFIGVQHATKTTGAAAYISFQSQTSERGKIAESNSGNNVTYNTSSDYRLKQDEVLISDGITRLKQLKPYQFKWKDNLEYGYVDGFFAHEVGEVIKGSATGSKDEVVTQEGLDDGTYNKNRSVGDMVAQGLDYSRLTPLLTAALQEAVAEIETLKTKVAALEAA